MSANTFAKEFAIGNTMAALSLGSLIGPNDSLLIISATAATSTGVSQKISINLASDGGAGSVIDVNRAVPATASVGTGLQGKIVQPGGKVYAQADVASGVVLQISGLIQ